MSGFEIKNPASLLRPWSSVKDLSEGIFSLLVPQGQQQSLRPSNVPQPPPKYPPNQSQTIYPPLVQGAALVRPAEGGGVYPPPGATPNSQTDRKRFPF